jgi:hypothetical protein
MDNSAGDAVGRAVEAFCRFDVAETVDALRNAISAGKAMKLGEAEARCLVLDEFEARLAAVVSHLLDARDIVADARSQIARAIKPN